MSEKIKFQLEFDIHVSPQMLFQYISTPSGLSEWYASKVKENNGVYTFSWEDSEEKAKIVRKKIDEIIRFRWIDNPNENYFEMKIMIDELTDDVSLLITDFSEPDSIEEAKMLWKNLIAELKHVLGVI